MNRNAYTAARRLIRENGRYALRWLDANDRAVFDRLVFGQRDDDLAERADIVAYCKRIGFEYNYRHLAKPV